MALAYGRLKVISRSKRNTVRALAYRTGCKVYDHRTGQLMTRRKKMHEVQHVELFLPKDAPEWALELRNLIALDRQKGVQQFSDNVEAHEKRKAALNGHLDAIDLLVERRILIDSQNRKKLSVGLQMDMRKVEKVRLLKNGGQDLFNLMIGVLGHRLQNI